MKNLRFLIYICGAICFLLAIPTANAQYYSSGQDPASTRWNQINSEHFQIIFPQNYEANAQYVANIMEEVYIKAGRIMDHGPKKVSIILHNQSSVSNATTAWAPKRIDFYHIPPYDTYAQNWLEQLAIHEYVHIIQFSKMNQGISKLLYYILGEQATAAMMGLFLPQWFIEGHATMVETSLSHSGRGRQARIEKYPRAQLLERGAYNYEKTAHGSYKDFVPSIYYWGYHITAVNKNRYGDTLWQSAINTSAKNPWLITPFSKGIKRITGKTKWELFHQTNSELKNLWNYNSQLNTQNSTLPFVLHSTFGIRHSTSDLENEHVSLNNEYVNYLRPQIVNDTTMLVIKTSLSDITRFVFLSKSGNEEIVYTPGYMNYGSLSYKKGKLAWAERYFDPRWSNRSYSVIKLLDLKTEEVKVFGKKERYFYPDLSPDATKICATEVTEEGDFKLIILNAGTGKKLNEFQLPTNDYIINPKWSHDGTEIVFITVGEKGKQIITINSQLTTHNSQLSPTWMDISEARLTNDWIYFSAPISGVDNIYRIDRKSGALYQITNTEYGAGFCIPDEKNERIIFENYTAYGERIGIASLTQGIGIAPDASSDAILSRRKAAGRRMNAEGIFNIANSLAGELKPIDKTNIPDSVYEVKRYRKGAHLFNLHSWAPVNIDVDNMEFEPGISLLSQNKLSSSFMEAGWKYDMNEERSSYYLDYTYAGWYPELSLNAEYAERRPYILDSTDQAVPFPYSQITLKPGISLPLNFATNKYSRSMRITFQWEEIFLQEGKNAPAKFKNDQYSSLRYSFVAQNLLKRSYRDLQSRWGQVITVSYRHTPFLNTGNKSEVFGLNSYFYFPGLFKHHHITAYFGYQYAEKGDLSYSKAINYARGYSGLPVDKAISLSASYKFPIFYPDWNVRSLAYFKRLKSSIFYDYTQFPDFNHSFSTVGIDFTTDVHLASFFAPFDLGVRTMYLPDLSDFRFEFLFAISFN